MKAKIFNQYVDEVCDTFELSIDELFQKTKEKRIVDARQMLFYLCCKRNMTVKSIEVYMEKKGLPTAHSTIVHHYREMAVKVSNDQDIENIANRIEACVQ